MFLLLIYFSWITSLATKSLYTVFYQVQSDVPRPNKMLDNRDDLSLSDEQVQQLLIEGGFLDDANPGSRQPQHYTYGNLPNQPPQQFTPASPGLWQHNQTYVGNQQAQPFSPVSELTEKEREALYDAGILPDPRHGIPTHGNSPVNQADIQGMFAEYERMNTNQPGPEQRRHYDKNVIYHNFNVTREAPEVHGIYDKLPSTMYASLPPKSSKDNFSSYLVSIIMQTWIQHELVGARGGGGRGLCQLG